MVDIDPAAGGRSSIEDIRAAGHDLPGTLFAFTGGGGFHLFYSAPAGLRVANTVGQLPVVGHAPGIDLRGDGGYVVAAPSVYFSGHRYRWSDRAGELEQLPPWLARPVGAEPQEVPRRNREFGASRYGSAALAAEVDAVRRLAVGERNHGLNRAAYSLGRLVAGGELATDLVYDELLAAAAVTGLGPREASRTIHSGLRAGATSPRRAVNASDAGDVGLSRLIRKGGKRNE